MFSYSKIKCVLDVSAGGSVKNTHSAMTQLNLNLTIKAAAVSYKFSSDVVRNPSIYIN